MMASQPRLYLVDGHALAYRTYFALTGVGGGSRWMTQSGEPTAGVYGFTSVLMRLMEEEQPEYLAVAFDTGRTFRDDLYPQYKATREKMPDDLRSQIERIREVVAAFEIPILEAEGYEADDVLGTVARMAAEKGLRVVILTGDRDLLQLATKDISILLSGQRLSESQEHGPPEVEQKMGVPPDKVVDLKALIGDSSDNIPGVRGVGPKTATALLKEYGSLDEIYQNLDAVQSRFRNKLSEAKDDAYLSQRLAAIVTDVDMPFDLEACALGSYDRERVAALFRDLEFRTLIGRVQGEAEEASSQQMALFGKSAGPIAMQGSTETTIVDTAEALEALVKTLSQAKQIAFDTETTSTDPVTAALVGISLAVEPGSGYYIPVGHRADMAGGEQLAADQVLAALKAPLESSSTAKVGHNLKYDFIMLARHGVRASPLAFDTMLAEWLCNPASRNLGLKNLAWVRLGIEMTEIASLIGTGRNQRTMAEVPIGEVAPYAAADAEVCLRLMPILGEELDAKAQRELFADLEMPLVTILAEMEMDGVPLDTAFLNEFSAMLTSRLVALEEAVFEQVGHRFNLNSTQQLSKVLFDEMQIPPPDRTRRTASGYYSTAASVLEALREEHPIVERILEHREIVKLKSTYAESLPQQVNSGTGRIHTSFSQTGSVTGRLASSNPNLQNIPIRSELGRQIRQAFVSDPGTLLLAIDYSQIELRVVAHMAEDEAMIKAFLDDRDIHATTAAAVFGTEEADVTADMRRSAKAVNFGLIYGMSAFGLSRSTDFTLGEAEAFVKAYFEEFPGVFRYLQDTRRSATEKGYVETLLGRRRYFPELEIGAKAISEQARARAEREAINAPIQGSAADIIKIAMIRLPQALEEAGLRARLLLQVHDELVLECDENEIAKTSEVVQRVMQEAFPLRVPLKTDAKAGASWATMEPLD